eukprot:14713686-Alexandrium_andersonii.AAC.1
MRTPPERSWADSRTRKYSAHGTTPLVYHTRAPPGTYPGKAARACLAVGNLRQEKPRCSSNRMHS